MKLKDGFILREVAGQTVVLSTGKELDLNTMITLNETGAYLWELMEKEQTVESLVKAMLDRYDVSKEQAEEDVKSFLLKLEETGAIV